MLNISRDFIRLSLFLCLPLSLSGRASSGATITYTPTAIVLGSSCTYTVNGPFPEGYPRTYLWEYRRTGVCTTSWGGLSANGNNQTASVIEGVPGTFEVRCTVTYSSYTTPDGVFHQAPAPDVPLVSITVPPPGGSRILSGTSQDTAVNFGYGAPGLAILFQVTCSSGDCGSYMTTMSPKEYLTNFVFMGVVYPDRSSGSGATFYLDHAIIYDIKTATFNQATWDGIGLNSTFASYTQKNTLSYTDPCGNVQEFTVGTYNFKVVKTGASVFQTKIQ